VRLLETVVENDTIGESEGDATPVTDSLTDADINPELLNEADTVFVPDVVAERNPDPDTVAETVSVPDPEIESLVETDCDDAPVRLEVNVGDTLVLPDFVGIADADTDDEAEILEEVLGGVDSVELAADDSDACDSVAELERAPEPDWTAVELTESEWAAVPDVDIEGLVDCVGDHDPDLENVEDPVGGGGSVVEPEDEPAYDTVVSMLRVPPRADIVLPAVLLRVSLVDPEGVLVWALVSVDDFVGRGELLAEPEADVVHWSDGGAVVDLDWDGDAVADLDGGGDRDEEDDAVVEGT
jgi:hypothetical protein